MKLSLRLGEALEKLKPWRGNSLRHLALAIGLATTSPLSSHAQTILNVTDFGAIGDKQQVWVNTTSNSAVVQFTNSLSPAVIGETIELFSVGQLNVGNNVHGINVTNAQDLIATISGVDNGTNVTITGDIPQVTSNGVYCIYGTNNAGAFQAAVNAASGTNTIINIPAGNYQMIPPEQYTNFTYAYNPYAIHDTGIFLNKGGISFIGAGPGQTILTADGAFKNQGHTCLRGGIFVVEGPVTNNYPLVWQGVTFDGGLQIGDAGFNNYYPPNYIDGQGWDGSSFAGLDLGREPLNILKEFNNCEFRHFRGEMIKGITGSAGAETILVTNSFAWDGNATFFNYNFAHTITDCTFSNMYEIEEFYLKYPTNAPSFFINNYATNINHNFISLNGGTLVNQPYVISNNTFYCNTNANGVATCPASSVLIANNTFIQVTNPADHTSAIVIGQDGAQPGSTNAFNTKIVIEGNTFMNQFYTVITAGGTGPTDQGRAQDIQVLNNMLLGLTSNGEFFLDIGGWATNIVVDGNNAFGSKLAITSGQYYNSPMTLVTTNNNYWEWVMINTSVTNEVDYGTGSRYVLTYPYLPNAFVYLNDSNSNQIPAGAQIVLTNGNWSGTTVPVYLNSARTRGPINLPHGKTVTVNWTNGQWMGPPPPAAPTGLRLMYNSTPSSKLFASTAPECPWISTVPFPDFIKRRAEIPFSE